MNKAKQFAISQSVVEVAFERVKLNKGAAGVDGKEIEDFEKDLERNLYKIWNRMSSGTYFPDPVKCVEIPKKTGGVRMLGIPTVTDRVAQMVAKMYLEPEVEPLFHTDSYGYRPNRSAHEAVAAARERCFKKAWVIDLDIKAFFDTLDHDVILQMVQRHTDCKWILLYIKRWLQVPMLMPDGALAERTSGTPQGSVISPLISNIVLHHVFDKWLEAKYPNTPFERYADDAVIHCETMKHAQVVLKAVTQRLVDYKLEVSPNKTKLVFCKNAKRSGSHENQRFEFLGYGFKPRLAKSSRGELFLGFSPAISDTAVRAISLTIRRWRLHYRSDASLEQLATDINPQVRGWCNYYGRFYRSAMMPVLKHINEYLVKWAMRKYKRMHRKQMQARRWLAKVYRDQPELFAHWKFGAVPNSSARVVGAG